MLLLVVAIHIIGVQLGVASECQSDTPTTQPCTMTSWQSMNHYVGYTQSIQVNVDGGCGTGWVTVDVYN